MKQKYRGQYIIQRHGQRKELIPECDHRDNSLTHYHLHTEKECIQKNTKSNDAKRVHVHDACLSLIFRVNHRTVNGL